ncbi:MAG: hypothetical protein KKF78_01710 [Candidatus Omnitrophica bacterium]|nr:hypothetical protein [Candidatus Omnitrophota bacterium]MBU1995852.1 hypothetical protein [Candidatus Omnitrophota bacterium]
MKLMPKNWILRELLIFAIFLSVAIVLFFVGIIGRIYFLPALAVQLIPILYIFYLFVRTIVAIVQSFLKKGQKNVEVRGSECSSDQSVWNVFKIIGKVILTIIWGIILIVLGEKLVYRGFIWDITPYVACGVLLMVYMKK